jgi:uncharacterized protein YlzI (FlbEa/FlbD family)
MAQFIKVTQKDGIGILINTNIIETVFPDHTMANCNTMINFNKASAKISFYAQETLEEIWKMILQ